MLYAGIGPTHANELLCITVPSVGESTLKAREREVGPQIEKLAKESWLESLESERNLWKEDSEKENVAIGASYDMGWQKRGKIPQQPDRYTVNSISERTEKSAFGYAFS